MELDEPVLSKEAMDAGYTNEGGLNNSIRFLKNIMGLWIIQECKRTWDKEGNVMSFAEIADGASKIEPCKFLINPDAEQKKNIMVVRKPNEDSEKENCINYS